MRRALVLLSFCALGSGFSATSRPCIPDGPCADAEVPAVASPPASERLPARPPADFDSVKAAAGSLDSPDPHLKALFRNALLDAGRQASVGSDGTVYVKTGDIPAEWLRDSSVQVRPYLFFAAQDPAVRAFLKAVITRQARMLAADPYANAFRADYSVWEEKFELDSLAYPIELAWTYWKVTGDASVFTADVARGFDAAFKTMKDEQDHGASPRRYSHRELKNNPVARTGMIWTGFRPSDDACKYNYLIPSEMMAVVALGELAEIEGGPYGDANKAAEVSRLRAEVDAGIKSYGIVDDSKHGRIYAYETDGLGHDVFMDDGNIPSLLSAPMIGYGSASDPVYKSTRSFLLSPDDPFFYAGKKDAAVRGIGSPHTPKGYVWPLALLAQGMTAGSASERDAALGLLLASDPGDGRLHESFDPDDPKKFTRKDFGWPNSLFAEFVMTAKGGAPPLPVGSTSDLGAAR